MSVQIFGDSKILVGSPCDAEQFFSVGGMDGRNDTQDSTVVKQYIELELLFYCENILGSI